MNDIFSDFKRGYEIAKYVTKKKFVPLWMVIMAVEVVQERRNG